MLHHDLGFEVLARAEIEELVCGPGIAVNAAVLAAPVRVDRRGETDVRAVVEGQDGTGTVGDELGQRRRWRFAVRILAQGRFRERLGVRFVARMGKPIVGIGGRTAAVVRGDVHVEWLIP